MEDAGLYQPIQKYKFESKSQLTLRQFVILIRLYQPIQKYKFESKSQLGLDTFKDWLSCINQYKNTNLKANHNTMARDIRKFQAVSTNTKIQIWKQITTKIDIECFVPMLYQPIQKYKFESKSQRPVLQMLLNSGCINQYKNTNLKANHNLNQERLRETLAVSTNTKIQIWKQITTFLPF